VCVHADEMKRRVGIMGICRVARISTFVRRVSVGRLHRQGW
jgi:hypothetical protein